MLQPLTGAARSVVEWVTMFHLAAVVVDPFAHESAWLLSTARRILEIYNGSDARTAFIVTGTPEQARQFLGPLADEFLVFADPDRAFVRSVGLERLPAWVHINHLGGLEASAEGWDPDLWRDAAEHLAERMSWSRPQIPAPGDPVPYTGAPALG